MGFQRRGAIMSQGTNQNTVDEETPEPVFASCCRGTARGTTDFGRAIERLMSACGPMMQRMRATCGKKSQPAESAADGPDTAEA
jgi:hypothetical protein